MNRSHAWFTDRATMLWAAEPGRSITCLVPAGSAEISNFPSMLETWIPSNFALPSAVSDFCVLVVKLVPDHSTSAWKVVSRLRDRVRQTSGIDVSLSDTLDASEALEQIIQTLAEHRTYLVLVIDRFQSFARLADDETVTLLSQLRSLEHESSLTTILISSHTCSTIRSRLSGAKAFFNSAYGDNHDQAVMPVLSLAEFTASAPHLSETEVAAVYAIGSGPDHVYQVLIDESRAGPQNLLDRCWTRTRLPLEAFIADLFGQIDSPEIDLITAAQAGKLGQSQDAHLRSLPLAGFLFNLDPGTAMQLRGQLADWLATALVRAEVPRATGALRLLFCSANPDRNIDLEKEHRAVEQIIATAPGGTKVALERLMAVTPDDFLTALRRFEPTVIHFSGHGCPDGIRMRGDGNDRQVVSGEALAQTLDGRGVDLVFLNACYSEVQAIALEAKVGSVIGTRDLLDDEAAIKFSSTFYRVLLDGGTLAEAVRDGRDGLALYDFEDVYACHGELNRRYVEPRTESVSN